MRINRHRQHYQTELVAEELESRILYSGSPAPDLAQGIVFESVETTPGNRYSPVEDLGETSAAAIVEFESNIVPVTLLSHDNLSETEVLSLLMLENESKWDPDLREGVTDSPLPDAPGMIEVENKMLPVVMTPEPAPAEVAIWR